MKVVIQGWIMRSDYSWNSHPTWSFQQNVERPKADDDTIPVQPYSIEVEVPDGDFIRERVAGVREEISRTYARAEATVQDLREKEGNLLALTNEVPAQTVEVGDERI